MLVFRLLTDLSFYLRKISYLLIASELDKGVKI